MTTNPWDLKGPVISLTYRLSLQRRINACNTVEDLKKLVLSTPKTDEAIYQAFNQKLQEIQNSNPLK